MGGGIQLCIYTVIVVVLWHQVHIEWTAEIVVVGVLTKEYQLHCEYSQANSSPVSQSSVGDQAGQDKSKK